MSSIETDSSNGLPGLRPVRDALGIQGKDLAEAVGITRKWLSAIETGASDCTHKLQRNISSTLACNPSDLMAAPTPTRLAEIRAAYTQRVADAARQAVSEAS